MNTSVKKQLTIRPASYNMWVSVFVMFLLIVAGLFYYATQKIEYVWRWNRMPIYFVYNDATDINSEIAGEVDKIVTKDKQALVTVKNATETATYTVPAENLTVVEGDIISL